MMMKHSVSSSSLPRRGVRTALLALLILVTPTTASVSAKESSTTLSPQHLTIQHQQRRQAQVDWLRQTPGGFFSDKLGFAPPHGDSPAGGIFALADIAKGERLIIVPGAAQFVHPPQAPTDDSEMCATARRLALEYVQGKQQQREKQTEERQKDAEKEDPTTTTHSTNDKAVDFWPYLQYVFEVFPHDQLPSAWEPAAKELLREIIANHDNNNNGNGNNKNNAAAMPMDPKHFGESTYYNDCDYYNILTELKRALRKPGTTTTATHHVQQYLEAAYRIVRARGWEHVLVPVYDMSNHGNGALHNWDQLQDSKQGNDDDSHEPSDMVVVALRDVKAGEEMRLSYNECHDYTCLGQNRRFITPHLFAEYGFVEDYSGSQRWRFDTRTGVPSTKLGTKGRLLIQIEHETNPQQIQQNKLDYALCGTDNRQADDAAQLERLAQFKVTWLSSPPTQTAQLEWLAVQMERLQGMTHYIQYQIKHQLAKYPRQGEAITEFHQALLTALELALRSAPTKLSAAETFGLCSARAVPATTNTQHIPDKAPTTSSSSSSLSSSSYSAEALASLLAFSTLSTSDMARRELRSGGTTKRSSFPVLVVASSLAVVLLLSFLTFMPHAVVLGLRTALTLKNGRGRHFE